MGDSIVYHVVEAAFAKKERPTGPVNRFVIAEIRRIRIQKRLTIHEVARRTGIPTGSYSCLETNRHRLSLGNLFRIVQVLGVPIDAVWPAGKSDARAKIIDKPFIARALAEAKAKRPRDATIEDVIESVCRATNLTKDQLARNSRERRLSHARALAALLVKTEVPHLRLNQLARRLKLEVSSLSHGIRRARIRLKAQRKFAGQFERAKKLLAESVARRNSG